MDDTIRRDRKYKAYWAVFLSNIVLLVWGKLTSDNYVELLIFTFGLYMAGNVGEHIANRKNENQS